MLRKMDNRVVPLYQDIARKLNLDPQATEEGLQVLGSILQLGVKPDTVKQVRKGPHFP